jgi:hypothetical protein
MKRIKIRIILLFFLFGAFSSCENFLDLPPTNQRAIENFEDLKRVMSSYMQALGIKKSRLYIPYSGFPIWEEEQVMMFEAYSDNIDFESNISKYNTNSNVLFGYSIEDRERFYADFFTYNCFDQPGSLWLNYYSAIGFFNIIEERLNRIEDGEEEERKQMLGELKVLRAYHIFKLLQWFAPYQDNELGIPVYLNTGGEVVGVSMPRKTQSEVYDIIIKDLTDANELLEITQPSPSFNQFFKTRFVDNLLAQVYWFKAESGASEAGDYENAKFFASAAIEGVVSYIPTTVQGLFDVWTNQHPNYPSFYNETPMFNGIGKIYGSSYATSPSFNEPKELIGAEDFTALFSEDDIRKAAYFEEDGQTLSLGIFENDVQQPDRHLRYNLFQPEEAYLILAEAHYRLNESAEAVSVLNTFKSFRNAGNADGFTGEDLLNEIINERRKEFFGNKDMRWLDLKRYARKTISRVISIYQDPITVLVEPNDYHYALPIPLVEVRENPDIIPNEGWTLIEY